MTRMVKSIIQVTQPVIGQPVHLRQIVVRAYILFDCRLKARSMDYGRLPKSARFSSHAKIADWSTAPGYSTWRSQAWLKLILFEMADLRRATPL